MTGRGMGPCAEDDPAYGPRQYFGRRMGFRGGRRRFGFGRGMGYFFTPQEEEAVLKHQESWLKQRLEAVQQRLKGFETGDSASEESA